MASWGGFGAEFATRLQVPVSQPACSALDAALPATWIQGLIDVEDWMHPVSRALFTPLGLRSLAILGEALSECSPSSGTATRLRDPLLFEDLWFELLVGLFLVRSGAHVVHEPTGPGVTGPDWQASWPSGETVDAEVKCLGISAAEQRARLIDGEQHRWLTNRVTPPGMSNRVFLEITLKMDRPWHRALTAPSDEEAVLIARSYYRAVREVIRARLAVSTEPGVYSLGEYGSMQLRPAAPGPPGLAGTLTPMNSDALDKSAVRVGRKLRDAEKQTGTAGNPGLLFMPSSPYLRSPFSFESTVARELGRRQAAKTPLSAVLIGWESSLWDLQGQLHVDQWFELVEGPQVSTLPASLLEARESSPCRHLHFEALPAEPKSGEDLCRRA